MLHGHTTLPEHLFLRGVQQRARTAELTDSTPAERGADADDASQSRPGDLPNNALLRGLAPVELEALLPQLESIVLASSQVLSEPGAPATHLYFPSTAVVALRLEPADGGRGVDVVTIGSEGMLSVSRLLGGELGTWTAVTRVAGSAARIAVGELERVLPRAPMLRARLHRYAASLMGQMAQTALCVQAHTIEQRLAALILLTADRTAGAPMVVTHEQLGLMLGIRRPGVTQVAATLRSRGLVSYRRGRIVLDDRSGLQATACPCYGIVRAWMERTTGAESEGFLIEAPASRPLA